MRSLHTEQLLWLQKQLHLKTSPATFFFDLVCIQEQPGYQYTKVKDPTPPHDSDLDCGCECGNFYIGETGRSSTDIRMKEHKAVCRLAAFEKSAVAEASRHAWQDEHYNIN